MLETFLQYQSTIYLLLCDRNEAHNIFEMGVFLMDIYMLYPLIKKHHFYTVDLYYAKYLIDY